jgi:hypothetical protein
MSCITVLADERVLNIKECTGSKHLINLTNTIMGHILNYNIPLALVDSIDNLVFELPPEPHIPVVVGKKVPASLLSNPDELIRQQLLASINYYININGINPKDYD